MSYYTDSTLLQTMMENPLEKKVPFESGGMAGSESPRRGLLKRSSHRVHRSVVGSRYGIFTYMKTIQISQM